MKNATFRITTPSVAVPSASSTRGPSKKTSIGAVVGPIVGVVVLIFFAGLFFLYRRRKSSKRRALVELTTPINNNDMSRFEDSMPSPPPLRAHESLITPWSMPFRPDPSPIPTITPPTAKYPPTPASATSSSHLQQAFTNATGSTFSRPPAYEANPSSDSSHGNSSWATTSRPFSSRNNLSGAPGTSPEGTALSQWARAHRGFISKKLEAKLDAAGYVPTDNPDSMTENEWMQTWGVTKLELGRLKALFAERQLS